MSTAAISPYVPSSLAEAERFAERLAKSPLVPDALKGKPGDILIIMATGHELGLGPMAAIRGLYVINGRVGIASALAVSLVKQHGSCEYFQYVDKESTPERAVYKTKRRGEDETKMDFTLEQAKRAGYLNRPPWRATPEQMLRARAARALAETVYPDALFGMPWDGDDDDYSEPPPKAVEAVVVNAVPAANSDGLRDVAATQVDVVLQKVAAASSVDELNSLNGSLQALHVKDVPAINSAMETKAAALQEPAAQMLTRIAEASTLAQLRQLAGPIREANLGGMPAVRDAFAARQAQMRRGGAR